MIKLPSEKIGSFYLGAQYDVNASKRLEIPVNYDARDLTTHAVCVGMTGSGKTGLCVGLLEEAAMDKVPAIVIDPKGDMTNLLLQFENLSAEQFKPWLNEEDANRKGLTLDAYAQTMAKKWEDGLKDWGQSKERIRTLKSSVEYTIYTPGSSAGIPINILGSFKAPKLVFDEYAEEIRERILGTVGALLGMIGNAEDPSRSKEGILLTNLFEYYWSKNEDLDITKLIMGIQSPPMSKLGVFDMETFYPEKERFKLAMDFNALIASPSFKNWLEGEDLDIDRIYFTEDGKPRHSIFYIAHLSESERMFFVTLLLNTLVSWIRRQSGTSSLRSLLYFDEIFGYFPPTANPPSKKPLLTILKQARAYGVGAVLVTQNPVDIDYKGLSNAGTWFIGKLQTERDKMRVADGLKGALSESGKSSNIDFDTLISALDSRVFLMHNVHEDAPVLFNTRWVMSYLHGPMTRPQIKALMDGKKSMDLKVTYSKVNETNQTQQSSPPQSMPVSIDPSIDQRFLAVWKSAIEAGMGADEEKKIQYQPKVLALAKVRFYDSRREVDHVEEFSLLSSSPDEFGRVDWNNSMPISNWQQSVLNVPDHPDNIEVQFEDIPESLNTSKELNRVEDEFSDWLYGTKRFEVLEHKKLKLSRKEDESVSAFLMRVETASKELRDEKIDALEERFDKKIESIHDKIRKEERDLAEAEAEKRDRRNDELINAATKIFGAVFGGRRSRSLSSVTSKRRMTRRANEKIAESEEELVELEHDLNDLKEDLHTKIEEIKSQYEELSMQVSKVEIKPRRADVKVDKVMLVWTPYWVSGSKRTLALG